MGTLAWANVSWGLPKEDFSWDTIWDQFEEFCKPEVNEVRACFDLLTSFRQGTRSVDEWYNAVQAQINLARYLPERAMILHRDIFWFFLKDEDFVSKTINEGSVDLDKFPASRVHQLAMKMESSKATARHIKQVAGDPQTAQINLMHHQHTELPNGKYKKRKPQAKQKYSHQKNGEQRPPNQYKKSFDPRLAHKHKDRCNKYGDFAHLEGFQCPAKNTSAKHATGLATTQAYASKRHKNGNQFTSKGNPLHIN